MASVPNQTNPNSSHGEDLVSFFQENDLEVSDAILEKLAKLGVNKVSKLRFLKRNELGDIGLKTVDERALWDLVKSANLPQSKPAAVRPSPKANQLFQGRRGREHRTGIERNADKDVEPSDVSSPVKQNDNRDFQSFAFLRLLKDGTPFKNQHQVRRFLLSAISCPDDMLVSSKFGSEGGLDRLREICDWPFSLTAGNRPDRLSFQRVVIPLLRLVTKPELQSSVLSNYMNPIYATLHSHQAFERQICNNIAQMTANLTIEDRYSNQHSDVVEIEWRPDSWVDILEPAAVYAYQILQRFRDAQYSAQMTGFLQEINKCCDRWLVMQPNTESMRVMRPLQLASKVLDVIKTKQEQEERWKDEEKRRSMVKGMQGSIASPDGDQDGPGELNEQGPRHDNDKVDIEGIDVAPTAGEALSTRSPYLPRNGVDTPHHLDGPEKLLDIHFRLLREDFLRLLRQGVSSFFQRQHEAGGRGKISGRFTFGEGDFMFTFNNPRVVGVMCNTYEGILYDVEFDDVAQNLKASMERRQRFWENTRRLQHGSLICLCWQQAAGHAMVFATIAFRDSKLLVPSGNSRPRIQISTRCHGSELNHFLIDQMLSGQNSQGAVILQASDDYFAYEAVLRALQKVDPATFPLAECLAPRNKTSVAIKAPAYLEEQTEYDFSCLLSADAGSADLEKRIGRVKILDHDSRKEAWRTLRENSSLDQGQLKALESVLTQEISLIQGPPGTGKSYIGTKIVQLLVRNARNLKNRLRRTASDRRSNLGPILCICFTNHALDQFLEGLLKNGVTDLVRVGGRSKSPALQKYSLNDLSRGNKSRTHKHKIWECLQTLKKLQDSVDSSSKMLCKSTLLLQDVEDLLYMSWPQFVTALKQGANREEDFEITRTKDQKKGRKDIFEEWQQGFCPYPDCSVHHPRLEKAPNIALSRAVTTSGGRFHVLQDSDKSDLSRPQLLEKLAEVCSLHPEGINESQFKPMLQKHVGNGFRLNYNDWGCVSLKTFLKEVDEVVHIKDGRIFANPGRTTSAGQDTTTATLEELVILASENPRLVGERVLVVGQGRQDDSVLVSLKDDTFEVQRSDTAQLHTTDRPLDVLVEVNDVWAFSDAERGRVCEYIREQLRDIHMAQLQHSIKRYSEARQEFQDIQDHIQLEIMRDASVIGLTTSGAAKYQHLVKSLGAKVIIVEEAAEVLEAHILASLSEHTQQLILIGDHQQLRPKVQVHELTVESGKGYNLDLSLFERLITHSRLPHSVLSVQRRMNPSISRLIRETLYPELEDADSVRAYPHVRGMVHDLYFYDHNHPEDGADDDESSSKSNAYEVRMVVALAMYLLRQGYKEHEITVLTPYVGQLLKLREALSAVTMTFVDERDVQAIWEAVGDGDSREIGDLRFQREGEGTDLEDRDGPFRDEQGVDEGGVGDGTTKAATSSTKEVVVSQDAIQRKVRLATVDNFQGEESTVIILSLVRNNAKGQIGFLRMPNRINVLLSRAMHGMYILGHAASLVKDRKSQMWPRVLRILRSDGLLGGSFQLRCPNHPDTVTDVSSPEDFETFAGDGGCTLQCEFRLSCGHQCPRRCHPDDPTHVATFCPKPCERLRPATECSLQHPCPRLCGQKCGRCEAEIACVPLPCGHDAFDVPCWKARPAAPAIRCDTATNVSVFGCDHSVNVPCFKAVEISQDPRSCPSVCGKHLPCGHDCRSKCGSCLSSTLNRMKGSRYFTKRAPAEREFPVPDRMGANCVVGLPFCAVNEAGIELQLIRLDHPPCEAACDRPCGSGHRCDKLCHPDMPCLPCSAPCSFQCVHTKCPRKCCEACAPCLERCVWSCPHVGGCSEPCGAPCTRVPCDERCDKLLACGHPCPSLCGEPCPIPSKACIRCAAKDNLSKVVDLILGTTLGDYSVESDGPLIVLTCGHVYTVETLDGHMGLSDYYAKSSQESAAGGVGAWSRCLQLPARLQEIKGCPECRHPIVGVRRYGRTINAAVLDQMTRRYVEQGSKKLAEMCKNIDNDQHEAATRDNPKEIARKAMLKLRKVEEKVKELSREVQPIEKIFAASKVGRERQMALKQSRKGLMPVLDILQPDIAIRCDAELLLANLRMKRLMLEYQAVGDSDWGKPLAKAETLLKEVRRDLNVLMKLCIENSRHATLVRAKMLSASLDINTAALLSQRTEAISRKPNSLNESTTTTSTFCLAEHFSAATAASYALLQLFGNSMLQGSNREMAVSLLVLAAEAMRRMGNVAVLRRNVITDKPEGQEEVGFNSATRFYDHARSTLQAVEGHVNVQSPHLGELVLRGWVSLDLDSLWALNQERASKSAIEQQQKSRLQEKMDSLLARARNRVNKSTFSSEEKQRMLRALDTNSGYVSTEEKKMVLLASAVLLACVKCESVSSNGTPEQ